VGSATQTINASTTLPLADSPLGRTISTTATDIWNDSCSVSELEYAISYGAVGATANPTIVHDVWKAEPGYWRDRVKALANERADATESRMVGLHDEIARLHLGIGEDFRVGADRAARQAVLFEQR